MLLHSVRAVMKTLGYPIAAAKLRKHTHLRAKCNNVTSWSSNAIMLACFLQIIKLIALLKIDEEIDLLRSKGGMKHLGATVWNHQSIANG